MRFLSQVELKKFELPNELQSRMVRESGWIDTIAGPVVVIFFLALGWAQQSPWVLIFAVIGLLSLVANWLHGRETELRVTNTKLTASGKLGRMFVTEMTMPISEVTSLGWSPGGEGEEGRLYLKRGWGLTHVLPGLSQGQAAMVIDTICLRFPEIEVERSPTSIIFGDDGGLITLGLSKPRKEGAEAKR